jgi:hypothetical protein
VQGTGAGLELSGIMHRAPAFRRATYSGEAIRIPPVFLADFHSVGDVGGLALLLWFMVTGGHPFLSPADVTWSDTHNGHHARVRQPWHGPLSWEPLLERSLFAEASSRPSLDEFLAELTAVHGSTQPYR